MTVEEQLSAYQKALSASPVGLVCFCRKHGATATHNFKGGLGSKFCIEDQMLCVRAEWIARGNLPLDADGKPVPEKPVAVASKTASPGQAAQSHARRPTSPAELAQFWAAERADPEVTALVSSLGLTHHQAVDIARLYATTTPLGYRHALEEVKGHRTQQAGKNSAAGKSPLVTSASKRAPVPTSKAEFMSALNSIEGAADRAVFYSEHAPKFYGRL